MGLIDRIREPKAEHGANEPSLLRNGAVNGGPVSAERELFDYLKEHVQDRIFQQTDPVKLEESGPSHLLKQISDAINEIIVQEKLLLTDADRDRLIQLTINDMVGLGRWSRCSRITTSLTSWSTVTPRHISNGAAS
jgi:hypothetical protein